MRILLGLLILIFFPLVIFYREITANFSAYFSGNIITKVITNQWHIALISIVIFVLFLVPLTYRKKANWINHGIAVAFFISLFVEMYGIPLTIFLASAYFHPDPVQVPNLFSFTFLGVSFGMDFGMSIGLLIITSGMALILLGWVTLYRNIGKGTVTTGIYSMSRHPQYLGFMLIVIGWFIAWPTILTVIFAPILVYRYLRVCRIEESEMSSKEYYKYKKATPFLF